MEAKVRKLFSETFVKTYDYPFIIGFLEANGINGIVPSFEQNENRALLSYDKFKQWWKQNYTQKQQKSAAASVNKANTDNVKVKYIIVRGDKHVVINVEEASEEYVKIEDIERFFFEGPQFKGLEDFIRMHNVSNILGR